MRSILGNRQGILGSVILLVILLMAVLPGPFLLNDPASADLSRRLQAPVWATGDWGYLLGADALGQDVWSRIVVGARLTLLISVLAVVVSMGIGVPLGILSGFYGGKLDSLISGVIMVQLAFPFILLAIMIIAAIGANAITLGLAMALSGWVTSALVSRGLVLSLRESQFIEAARSVGCSTPRILRHHLLPHLVRPMTVIATLELARMILLGSALSFLGLGIQPPDLSWGSMISDGRAYISTAWWLTAFPGLAITLTVLGINAVGNWFSDVRDPSGRVS